MALLFFMLPRGRIGEELGKNEQRVRDDEGVRRLKKRFVQANCGRITEELANLANPVNNLHKKCLQTPEHFRGLVLSSSGRAAKPEVEVGGQGRGRRPWRWWRTRTPFTT